MVRFEQVVHDNLIEFASIIGTSRTLAEVARVVTYGRYDEWPLFSRMHRQREFLNNCKGPNADVIMVALDLFSKQLVDRAISVFEPDITGCCTFELDGEYNLRPGLAYVPGEMKIYGPIVAPPSSLGLRVRKAYEQLGLYPQNIVELDRGQDAGSIVFVSNMPIVLDDEPRKEDE